jgi:RNA polymerase sigma-70 factor, ECF subfamily
MSQSFKTHEANPSLEEEQRLFLRLKQDPSTIGEVYDLYANRLYGFLLKRCGHKETAEDLVSRTFMKFLEALPRLTWQGVPLRAYLFRIAGNALIDHWRKSSTKHEIALDTDVFDPPGADDPAWSAACAFDGVRLMEQVAQLSPRDQEVLNLRFIGDLSPQEMAPLLEVSPNHAAVLVYRALGRLRSAYLAASSIKNL